MKNTLIIALVAIVLSICGCKTVWTVDESYKVGTGVGFTTAYVLNNQAKVDDATRNTIIKIVTEVQKYVPGTNETFYSAWTPIMNKFVDDTIKNGDITEKTGTRVKKDFGYVITLLDKYVEKKGIKSYQDSINAFVDGFCTTFLVNFKPINTFAISTKNTTVLDKYTYDYLSTAINK